MPKPIAICKCGKTFFSMERFLAHDRRIQFGDRQHKWVEVYDCVVIMDMPLGGCRKPVQRR